MLNDFPHPKPRFVFISQNKTKWEKFQRQNETKTVFHRTYPRIRYDVHLLCSAICATTKYLLTINENYLFKRV